MGCLYIHLSLFKAAGPLLALVQLIELRGLAWNIATANKEDGRPTMNTPLYYI
jgi:hypothetical protein